MMARILSALATVGVETGVLPNPPKNVSFPIAIALAGGFTMWLFEFYPKSYNSNTRRGMKYIYKG